MTDARALQIPQTERADPKHHGLHTWPTTSIISSLVDGQWSAIAAVQAAQAEIAKAADAAAARLLTHRDGRLCYTGAGTSGRLAVGDAVELTPTFGWPAARFHTLIAGGNMATRAEVSQAEDDETAAQEAVISAGIGEKDVLIGLAASGNTPFTCRALEVAQDQGALTIGTSNAPQGRILQSAQYGLLLDTGAEALAGSTRLSAGTAQKVFLNCLSTAIMVRLGLVYQGRMVAMRPTNAKLKVRARQMISELCGISSQAAQTALETSAFDLPIAILMGYGATKTQAHELLDKHAGHVANAITEISL